MCCAACGERYSVGIYPKKAHVKIDFKCFTFTNELSAHTHTPRHHHHHRHHHHQHVHVTRNTSERRNFAKRYMRQGKWQSIISNSSTYFIPIIIYMYTNM